MAVSSQVVEQLTFPEVDTVLEAHQIRLAAELGQEALTLTTE